MARKTQKIDTLISQIHDALSKHIDIMKINVGFSKMIVSRYDFDIDSISITVFYFTDNRLDFTNITESFSYKNFSLQVVLNKIYTRLKIDDPNNNIEFSF